MNAEGASRNEAWATEKAPHPVLWLDHDGDAVRVDEGVYTWIDRARDHRSLLLRGREGLWRVDAELEQGLPAETARAICAAARACGADVGDAGRLITDGVTARRRAVERFCGLGAELDGSAFDAEGWRRILAQLSLEEIHGQLRAYEIRFDQKYPPSPVWRPEKLPEIEAGQHAETALEIARE